MSAVTFVLGVALGAFVAHRQAKNPDWIRNIIGNITAKLRRKS